MQCSCRSPRLKTGRSSNPGVLRRRPGREPATSRKPKSTWSKIEISNKPYCIFLVDSIKTTSVMKTSRYSIHCAGSLIGLSSGLELQLEQSSVTRFWTTTAAKHVAVGADPGVPRCAGPMKSKLSTRMRRELATAPAWVLSRGIEMAKTENRGGLGSIGSSST